MKTIKTAIVAWVSAVVLHAGAITTSSGPVTPGEWNSNFNAVLKYAEDNGVPMVAVWGKSGCHNCEQSYRLWFDTDTFKSWMAESGIVFYYVKSPSWSSYTTELNWISGSLTAAPFVRVYWKKNGKDMTGGVQRFSGLPSKVGSTAASAMQEKIMGYIPSWTPKPKYPGGAFSITNTTEALCMEASPSTTVLRIPLVREATEACTQKMEMNTQKSRSAAATFDVKWAEGEKEIVFEINDFAKTYYSEGATLELTLLNEESEVISSTVVRCVAEPANSSSNPYWIGEKSADELAWGDWTMDLDVAQAKVKAAKEADACILGYVDGSLWCPWCHKGETNFLEKAAFKEFVAARHAVLVQIDCPTLGYTAPTLLSHETGVNHDAGGPAEVSGTGYLTRKMVDLDLAQEIYARNANIVSNLWQRPESTAKRVGMGNFILIDKNNKIKGRLNWAREGANAVDLVAANLKRFEELFTVLTEEGEEDNQNWRTTKAEVPVIGVLAGNTLSSSDLVDTFKIADAARGSKQKFVITGDEADLEVSVISVDKGVEKKIKSTKGKASATLSLLVDIPAAATATNYLVVAGDTSLANSTFAGDHKTVNPNPTLASYTVQSEGVLVPQETRATVTAEPRANPSVNMILEEGVTYRLEGLDVAACADLLEGVEGDEYGVFFTVKSGKAGEVALPLVPVDGAGTLTYQTWVGSEIGFADAPKPVSESIGKPLTYKVVRTGGQSGWVQVRVSLDEEKTTLLAEDDDHPRLAFEPVDLRWEEGDLAAKDVTLTVYDYPGIYFGEGDIALKIESLTEEFGSFCQISESRGTLVQPVTEDDKAEPGVGAFSGAKPFFSKKLTVYVREGEAAVLKATRLNSSDGRVSALLTSSLAGVEFEADGLEKVSNAWHLFWDNHQTDEKSIFVTGVTAGKTAKIKLGTYGTFKTLAASNTISVVGVAMNAPAFANDQAVVDLYRYIATSNLFPLAEKPKGKVTFVKTQGTLPSGLKAVYDAGANALALVGSVTAKPGVYPVVYQVKDGSIAGLTVEITLNVVSDPTDPVNYPDHANPVMAKSVTIQNIPVYGNDETDTRRMVGLIQSLALQQKGKSTAKFICEAGTFSLKANGWDDFRDETRTLVASMTSGKTGYVLDFTVDAAGIVEATLAKQDEGLIVGKATAKVAGWSKTNTAAAWNATYSVALPVLAETVTEEREGLAPRGSGYLAIKSMTTSALATGTMTWAGILPNGTAISGKTVLLENGAWADFPIYIRTTKNICSLPISIKKDSWANRGDDSRVVLPAESAVAQWKFIGGPDQASVNYSADLDICGAVYEKDDKLTDCCEYPQPKLTFDVSSLVSVLGGTPVSLDPIDVVITDANIAPAAAQMSAAGVTAKFTRATGLMTGTIKIPYMIGETRKVVSAKWAGIVLPNWGDCCEMGVPTRPFVNGAFYFNESLKYEFTSAAGKTSTKTVTVVRGSAASVDDRK